MIRNEIYLFLALLPADDLIAAHGKLFDVEAQRAHIAGYAHLVKPAAQLPAGDRMVFIGLSLQQLPKLHQLEFLLYAGHDGRLLFRIYYDGYSLA